MKQTTIHIILINYFMNTLYQSHELYTPNSQSWCPFVQLILPSFSVPMFTRYIQICGIGIVSSAPRHLQINTLMWPLQHVHSPHDISSAIYIQYSCEQRATGNIITKLFQPLSLGYILEQRMPGIRTYRPILRKIEPVRVSVL